MDAGFWHERWTNEQIGFHQATINTWLMQHWPLLAMPKGTHVFVPLCGKSKDMLWLAEQGYRVTGIELSEKAVEAFFAENDLIVEKQIVGSLACYRSEQISIYCGNYFDLNINALGSDVAAVYDRASLIALPEQMRPDYIAHQQQLIRDGVPVLLVTMEYPQQQMSGPPFSVSQTEVEKLYTHAQSVELLGSIDLLAKEKRFVEKGITSLTENSYRIVM